MLFSVLQYKSRSSFRLLFLLCFLCGVCGECEGRSMLPSLSPLKQMLLKWTMGLWESRLSLVFQPFSRFSVYFLFYFFFSRRHKSIGWILGSFPTLKVPYAKCGPNTASIRGVLFLTTSSSFHAVADFPSGASTWIQRKTNWSNSSMKLAFSGPVPGKQRPSPGLMAALREAISSSDPSPEYPVEACGIKPG